ncbi:Uma2 family endonuclease [Catenuloplanes indicus]|uniref:Uma2 family endonuclease n=1 Tax=Catenuloplanes indicus TaxID=137267 RepID=A0AAE3VXY6_9ACTN|nr:Uma2 family endonuclease [Catenuloplanes indicus]MDQ0365750.1 Uma2 family endonuclease [Catenuloplanes indicus]
MSAEPIGPEAAVWQPDPVRQALANYTLQDLLNLPPDAPRVELVDGVIHVVPSANTGHQTIATMLCNWFYAHAPEEFFAYQDVGVALGPGHTRQPDVLVCYDDVVGDNEHYVLPADVVLAVEVVSPSTKTTDRFAKPGEYAAAGIPCYWRIERDPLHVFAYQLREPTRPSGLREYELVADSDTLIKVEQPFPIEFPLSEIVRRPRPRPRR